MDWMALTASSCSLRVTLKTFLGEVFTCLASLAHCAMGISIRAWHSEAGVVAMNTTSLSSVSQSAEVWLGTGMPLTAPLSPSRVPSVMRKEMPDGCSSFRTSVAEPAAGCPVPHAVEIASKKL